MDEFILYDDMICDVYLPELENYDTRVNVFYGGGGSGKSHFVAQKLIFKLLQFENRRCLVIRKTQASHRDSTFHMFKTILTQWGLINECKITSSHLEIMLPNGSVFIFKGLDDLEKIKSISGIDDIVIEEATEITENGFDQLNIRLRSSNPYNQIHLMFNPVGKENWVYKKWFDPDGDYYKDTPSMRKIRESTAISHTTYLDNPFLPKSQIDIILSYKDSNYAYYNIYALGEFATLDKLIYQDVEVRDFNYIDIIREDENIDALFGLDFGYTADPTAFVALLHDKENKIIYIYDEFYERGLLNNEIANEVIKRGYRKEKITADSAEPRTIDELSRLGLTRITPAKKGPGSIMSGIQYIQQHKVIIHPSCMNMIEEMNNYTWVKNKDNEYINKPADNYNHLQDALRYALSESSLGNRKMRVLRRSRLGI